MKNKVQIINILSILAMVYFGIPKLIGSPASKKGFSQFESLIPLDPDFFRVFTGISEIFIAILILSFAITNKTILGFLAYSFLLVTMLTALVLEFFARPSPETPLVALAIVLAIFSLYQLFNLKKNYNASQK